MSDTYTYVGRADCGCVRVLIVDRREDALAIATEVAKAIRVGMTIDRLPTETVRTMPWHCAQHPAVTPAIQGEMDL